MQRSSSGLCLILERCHSQHMQILCHFCNFLMERQHLDIVFCLILNLCIYMTEKLGWRDVIEAAYLMWFLI